MYHSTMLGLDINPCRHLNTAACSLPHTPPVGLKRKGRVKARKLVGQDKICVINEGEEEEERKKSK